MRKEFKMKSVRFSMCVCFLFIYFLPGSYAAVKSKPILKNVIIISVDTLRADHLGCYGYPLDTSPAIDRFSKDGILFSKCYSLTPLTTPSFSTLMSGLPPYKHGAKRNGLSLYRKVKTLPYYFRKFGYRSAAFISNWPLRKKLCGLHRHFDDYNEVFTKRRWLGVLNSEGDAGEVNEKALHWLEDNKDKRFFLWVQYTEPHAPYINHKQFAFDYNGISFSQYPPGTRMKKIKKYDTEIAYTDSFIGKLIGKLKEMELYKDSLIIFHSDHGESFGEHDYFRHGRKLYNSTLHVPLIIKLPDNSFKDTVRDENVSLLDLGKTIFSVLNIMTPPHLEGFDLFKQRNFLSSREIILETYGGVVHFRRKNKKYHMKIKPIRYGFLKDSVKFIYNLKAKDFEAYDLSQDPFEIKNAAFKIMRQDKGIKEELLSKVFRVLDYIKLNKMRNTSEVVLSEEDMKRLESLGYFGSEKENVPY
jgi:arylsulfatase A-like enzyme